MDMTKLDFNWGGPGFPSYEGRLEDGENDGPMDSDARQDAALAAFNGDPDPNAADPNAADPNAADPNAADPNAADPNAADPNAADPNAGQLTDEQRLADPQFQQLSEFRDNVANTLSEFGIPLDDKGNPNLQEAGLQLKDAAVLYDIMAGKGTPSALLDTMAQTSHWTNEQKNAVAQDLIGWLTKNGHLKDGAAAKPAGQQPGGVKDPVMARLDKIEQDRKDEKSRNDATAVRQHQEAVFKDKFLPKLTELCKQKSIPDEDFGSYATQVAAKIAGNKAILARIEKGNFVDVQKFFTEIHNAEVARLQRWTKSQTAAAQKKEGNPRIPAGGAAPAPAGSAKKVDVKDRDSRIAAATEML